MAAHAAAAAAMLLSAALTVGASPAYAAPSDGPTVEFTGGSVLGLLVCKSDPSTERLSVRSDTRITFVNRLGEDASLLVDGKSVQGVGANQAVPVVFHHGPVEVAMTFKCSAGLMEQFTSARVAVTAPAPAAVRQNPTTKPPAAGTTQSAAAAAAPRAAGTGSSASGQGGTSRGAAAESSPTADTPDGTGEDGTTATEPLPDSSAAAGGVTLTPPAEGVPPAVAVEPVLPAPGPVRNGPAGLLALVATVCVVGVGMAAIRAIVAQRATRSSFA